MLSSIGLHNSFFPLTNSMGVSKVIGQGLSSLEARLPTQVKIETTKVFVT